jgi:hypothetical protein
MNNCDAIAIGEGQGDKPPADAAVSYPALGETLDNVFATLDD